MAHGALSRPTLIPRKRNTVHHNPKSPSQALTSATPCSACRRAVSTSRCAFAHAECMCAPEPSRCQCALRILLDGHCRLLQVTAVLRDWASFEWVFGCEDDRPRADDQQRSALRASVTCVHTGTACRCAQVCADTRRCSARVRSPSAHGAPFATTLLSTPGAQLHSPVAAARRTPAAAGTWLPGLRPLQQYWSASGQQMSTLRRPRMRAQRTVCRLDHRNVGVVAIPLGYAAAGEEQR